MDIDDPPESLSTRVGRWLSLAGVFFLLGNGPDDERPPENDIVAASPGGQNQEEEFNIDDRNGRSPSPPPQHFQPLNWPHWPHWPHWPPAAYAQDHLYNYPYTDAFPFVYPYGDPYAFYYTDPHPIYIPLDFDHLFPDAFHHPVADPDDQQVIMEFIQRMEVQGEDNHLEIDGNRQNSSCALYVENIGPLEHTSDSSLLDDTVFPSTSGLSSSRRCIDYNNDNEAVPPKRPRCSDDSDSD